MNANEIMTIAIALTEQAEYRGELQTSEAFMLAPNVSRDFGSGETPSMVAGLLAGAGFLEAKNSGFVRGERPLDQLTCEALLEGATRRLCPPQLMAAYYVAANIHPLWGLRAHKNPATEFARLTREYVAALASGVEFCAAVADYREKISSLGESPDLPYLVGPSSGETMYRMAADETGHKIVRALYGATVAARN